MLDWRKVRHPCCEWRGQRPTSGLNAEPICIGQNANKRGSAQEVYWCDLQQVEEERWALLSKSIKEKKNERERESVFRKNIKLVMPSRYLLPLFPSLHLIFLTAYILTFLHHCLNREAARCNFKYTDGKLSCRRDCWLFMLLAHDVTLLWTATVFWQESVCACLFVAWPILSVLVGKQKTSKEWERTKLSPVNNCLVMAHCSFKLVK